VFAGVGSVIFGPAQGIMRFLGIAYAVASFSAAIGLWKMRDWAFVAFLAWAGVAVVIMFVMQLWPARIAMSSFVGFACFVVIILLMSATYVKITLKRMSNQADKL
jgi:uncharacterized membrane protein (DUF2068 family)